MIEIIEIWAGWFHFKIHHNHMESHFTVSYLDDFEEIMDYLLGIGEGNEYKYDYNIESRAITLDGEGTELKLSLTKREYEGIATLVWWLNDEPPVTLVIEFTKFKQSYIDEMNKNKDKYELDFLMNYDEEK